MSIVTVFVTRNCLSQGIRKMEGTIDEESGVFTGTEDGLPYVAESNDWYMTWENASHRAHRVQKDKIRSLRRHITKLEELTFTKPE